MLVSNIPKAYFDRFIPRPKDGFSSYNMRNNYMALASCDFLPLRAVSSLIIETHDFGTDATASATYSGTGVTVTKDKDNNHLGLACLKATVDATGERTIMRTNLSSAIDISDFTKLGIWHRCDKASSAIQFVLKDSDGNESYWDITTNGTPDTWEQAALILASPDSNNGTNADLSDIVSYGYKGLDASTVYLFDEITAYVWAMKVYIHQSYLGNYFYPIYSRGIRIKFDGGFTPIISAPSVNPRIDLIYLDGDGALAVATGEEVAAPDYDDIPTIPIGGVPLYAVYLPTTATQIVEYHLKDGYPDDGYIYADLRPWFTNIEETILINTQTDNYVLVLSDNGKLIDLNNAAPKNLTVPLNSSVIFPIGTVIAIRQKGAGQITIVPEGGVTINSASGLKTLAQYSVIAIMKIDTDTWTAMGDLEA